MYKSPDAFEADLRRERRIEAGRSTGESPALAADRALREELRGLGASGLPVPVRERVLAVARPSRSTWPVALAAGLAIAIAVSLIVRAPPPPSAEPDREQLAELGYALETIRSAGRRAVLRAGEEVARSLRRPDYGLADLPYLERVREAFRPAEQPNQPPTEEQS